MVPKFTFLKPKKLIDNELELVLVKKVPAEPQKDYVPSYHFDMQNKKTEEKIGFIHLRIGYNENIKYGGHIGYEVEEKFRGHRYATRSIKLLLPFAKKHGINPVWITCSPENIASKKTCKYAGGKLVDIVNLPKHNEQYKLGDRKKCRFRFDL